VALTRRSVSIERVEPVATCQAINRHRQCAIALQWLQHCTASRPTDRAHWSGSPLSKVTAVRRLSTKAGGIEIRQPLSSQVKFVCNY
jgi:hypothetical protein